LVAVDAVAITQAHTEMLVVVLVPVLAESMKVQSICQQPLHAQSVLHNPVQQPMETKVLLLVFHQCQEGSLVETMHRTLEKFLLLVVVECLHSQVVVKQCSLVSTVRTVEARTILVAVAVVVVAQLRLVVTRAVRLVVLVVLDLMYQPLLVGVHYSKQVVVAAVELLLVVLAVLVLVEQEQVAVTVMPQELILLQVVAVLAVELVVLVVRELFMSGGGLSHGKLCIYKEQHC